MAKKFLINMNVEMKKEREFNSRKEINVWISEEDFNNNKRFFTYVKDKYIGSWSTMTNSPNTYRKESNIKNEITSSEGTTYTEQTVERGCEVIHGRINIGNILELGQDIYVELTDSYINYMTVRNEFYKDGELKGSEYDYSIQQKQIDTDRRANDAVKSTVPSEWEFTMNLHDED